MSEEKAQRFRRGDRVRATEEIRMADYPFCDILAGDLGTVVAVETPEKLKSCWSVTILFDLAIRSNGEKYLVQLAYPTIKVKKFLSAA